MKVKKAEAVAILDKVSKVRGSEKIQDIRANMKENTIVHVPWFEIVFNHLAPVRQWKP